MELLDGVVSCDEKNECNRQDAQRGMDYSNCVSVHAEQNTIIAANREDMKEATMYLVGKERGSPDWKYVENPAPCSLCKRMIINAGISKVIVRESKTQYSIYYTECWKFPEEIIGGY